VNASPFDDERFTTDERDRQPPQPRSVAGAPVQRAWPESGGGEATASSFKNGSRAPSLIDRHGLKTGASRIATAEPSSYRQSVIEVLGLTKRYGSLLAVDDLTFQVRPGYITGFVGPNGSGKSTTMRLLLGLDRADAGDVRVSGRRYCELRWPLREVGALLEGRPFHSARSGRDHLLSLAAANAIDRSRVEEVLELVGLSEVAGRRAGTYSLGMAQRLGLATALLGDPQVLLLDEPLNGLDPAGIRWFRVLLKKLAGQGRTIFVSSHLIGEMALTAEHLLVIEGGRLVADASVAQLAAGWPSLEDAVLGLLTSTTQSDGDVAR
jgi:ABC-2 type transport system ATP-binding protein